MNESLRAKTVANLSYNLLSRLLIFSLSSVTGIILARNLSANDYGIVGFAMIFIGFLRQFNDLGITPSVIQKESIGERELYTAFTLKILLGFLIFAASFIWGSISQEVFDNPAVKGVLIVLDANFIISSFGFLPVTVLTRQMRFKRLTIPQVGSQVAATVAALAAVYLGFRYWSIVASDLAASIASVAIVYTLRAVPPKLRWDKKLAMEHLKFGSHLFFAGFMMFLLFNADNFVVGAVGGAAILGFYAVAFNWSTKASGFIGEATHNILLSTFSRVQKDQARLRRGYLTILEYVSFAAILANVLLLNVSKELLTLVLGGGTAKWLPALFALKILCVYGVLRAVLEPAGSVAIAIGRPALVFKSNAMVAGLEIICLYPALRYFGIEGVALVVTLSYSVQSMIYFPVLRREMDLPFSTVLRSVRPAVLSGCLLALSGFAVDQFIDTSWLSVIVKLTLGCGLYLVTYGCITRWKIFKDAREIAGTVFLKASQSPI
jgi:O-antigen/teichoic acid export membrane protein